MRPVLLLLLAFASTARAQDAFEIQVYDSETAAPATGGFELHTIYVAQGTKTAPASQMA